MKDFAKSIVCNAKAEVAKIGNAKCGNAEVFKDGNVWVVLYAEGTKSKEFKTEAEAKKFAAQVGNSVPDDMINGPAAAEIRETAGRVYKKEMREDDLARATAFELAKKYKNFQKSSTFMETIKDVLKKFKTGNSKAGNANYRYKGYLISKSDEDGEIIVYKPNGRDVAYRGTKSESMAKDWIDHHATENAKCGNAKVGNADKYSGNYIIMSDDGDVWFRDEHEDVSIRSIDSWAQKRIAEYQRSIDEIKKGVQEAKQAAKKFGLL